MKETTNVSIAGIAFRLDSKGYLLLKNYLTRIELGYRDNPDGTEILADIEARICELILNLQPADQPVTEKRIREIIDQLGMPDDFPAQTLSEEALSDTPTGVPAALGTGINPSENRDRDSSPLQRRLYRNPEGAKLGGVCSGLGAYFNVEPVFIRLGFFAPLPLIPLLGIITRDGDLPGFFAVLFGLFFMLYFLLWFSIPMARTPRQKLEMRGERVTASSIQQGLKRDFQTMQPAHKSERSASIWADLIYIIGRIMLFFVKFVTILIACLLLIGAVAGFITTLALMHATGLPETINLCGLDFHANAFSGTALLLIMLSLILPMLGIGYLLMGLVLRLPRMKKTLSVLLGIWIIIAIFAAAMAARWQYQQNDLPASPRHKIIMQNDTLRVEVIRIGDSTVTDTVRIEYFTKP